MAAEQRIKPADAATYSRFKSGTQSDVLAPFSVWMCAIRWYPAPSPAPKTSTNLPRPVTYTRCRVLS
jgi:hypothetical protein